MFPCRVLILPCLVVPCSALSCLAKPASCPIFPLRGSFCCCFCLFFLYIKAHLLHHWVLTSSLHPQPWQDNLSLTRDHSNSKQFPNNFRFMCFKLCACTLLFSVSVVCPLPLSLLCVFFFFFGCVLLQYKQCYLSSQLHIHRSWYESTQLSLMHTSQRRISWSSQILCIRMMEFSTRYLQQWSGYLSPLTQAASEEILLDYRCGHT